MFIIIIININNAMLFTQSFHFFFIFYPVQIGVYVQSVVFILCSFIVVIRAGFHLLRSSKNVKSLFRQSCCPE